MPMCIAALICIYLYEVIYSCKNCLTRWLKKYYAIIVLQCNSSLLGEHENACAYRESSIARIKGCIYDLMCINRKMKWNVPGAIYASMQQQHILPQPLFQSLPFRRLRHFLNVRCVCQSRAWSFRVRTRPYTYPDLLTYFYITWWNDVSSFYKINRSELFPANKQLSTSPREQEANPSENALFSSSLSYTLLVTSCSFSWVAQSYWMLLT